MNKQELRKDIREKKRHFPQSELREMSLRICDILLANERIKEADTILMYYPLPDEVDVRPLLQELEKQGKTLLLPKVVSNTEMTLHRYEGESSLCIGSYNIMEPIGREYESIEMIDLAIVPGMAFDKEGNRLGRGKGYYDRFLSRARNIYKVGVCFPFQLVESVPSDDNDIKMNDVIRD